MSCCHECVNVKHILFLHCMTSGKSNTITVIAAVSTFGESVHLFMIFKGDRLLKDIRKDGAAGTCTEARSSKTGWSNSNLFLDFFSYYYVHRVTAKPFVFLV